MDGSQPLDPRKTIFVGGVPRPLRAGTHCSTGHVGCAAWFGEHWGKRAWQRGNIECGDTVGDTAHPEVVLGEKRASLEPCLVLLCAAVELAMIMDRLYGGVCYAGIDTDPELKYPKGAGRVAFSNQQSYIAAISARFVQLQHGEIDKRVRPAPPAPLPASGLCLAGLHQLHPDFSASRMQRGMKAEW